MPYPAQFPYDLLEASPNDSAAALFKKRPFAMRKHPKEATQIKHASDELRNVATRLGYDILLISNLPEPDELTEMIAQLDNLNLIPDSLPLPKITLALTDLMAEPAHLYRPVPAHDPAILPIEQFMTDPITTITIHFDR